MATPRAKNVGDIQEGESRIKTKRKGRKFPILKDDFKYAPHHETPFGKDSLVERLQIIDELLKRKVFKFKCSDFEVEISPLAFLPEVKDPNEDISEKKGRLVSKEKDDDFLFSSGAKPPKRD